MRRKSTARQRGMELNFREELGLKLDEIAAFCGVSVSLLGMIESGERHWPWKVGGNHQKLTLATYQSVQNPMDDSQLPKQEPWEIEKYYDKIHELTLKKIRTQKRLKKMILQYSQAKTLYQTCTRLKTEFHNEDSLEAKAIDYWEHLSKIRLRETGPVSQKRLQMKMEELEKIMVWLRGL